VNPKTLRNACCIRTHFYVSRESTPNHIKTANVIHIANQKFRQNIGNSRKVVNIADTPDKGSRKTFILATSIENLSEKPIKAIYHIHV